MKILIIDDRADNINSIEALIKLYLQEAELFSAKTGQEGIEIAITEIPDLILLDILMPGMDGFETCLKIKSIITTKDIPVLMISAIADKAQNRVKAMKANADAVISKPFDSEELILQIKLLLRLKKTQDELKLEKQNLELKVQEKTKELFDKNKLLEQEIEKKESYEKLLVKQNHNILDLINSIPASLILVNSQMRVSLVNDTMKSKFNILEQNIEDVQLKEIFNCKVNSWKFDDQQEEENYETICSHIEKVIDTGISVLEKDVRIINLQNDELITLWFSMNIEPILINDEMNVLVYLNDITDRKNAEVAIIESQRLNAIGEMTSAIAHDFNNSIQAIQGNVELLNSKLCENESLNKYFRAIETTCYDASSRVKTLQKFANKSTRKDDLVTINIEELISDVLKQTEPKIKELNEKQKIKIEVKNEIKTKTNILGEVGELRSAFFNIVKNSIEAMKEGGILNLSFEEDNNFVNIFITDTGIGMDEKAITRIFQPFYSTKGLKLGRGLGMTSAYSTIKSLSGTLKVKESKIGYGTKMQITLPISRLKQINKKVIQENYSGDCSVLFIDDDELVREVVSEMISELGFKADVCSCVKDGLEQLNKHKYDLIISDLGMPDIDGIEFAKIVRNELGLDTPFALLTGWAEELDSKKIKEIGIDHFLSKPYSLRDIEALINKTMVSKVI